MHVCYRVQQDPVGKDKIPFLSYLYGFLELMIVEEPSLPFCISGLFYLYIDRYYSICIDMVEGPIQPPFIHQFPAKKVQQFGSSQSS
jgi:hypothetical protein